MPPLLAKEITLKKEITNFKTQIADLILDLNFSLDHIAHLEVEKAPGVQKKLEDLRREALAINSLAEKATLDIAKYFIYGTKECNQMEAILETFRTHLNLIERTTREGSAKFLHLAKDLQAKITAAETLSPDRIVDLMKYVDKTPFEALYSI